MKYKKNFLVIAPETCVSYKEVFPLIRDKKIWLGYNHVKEFRQPDGSLKKFGNIVWFTNIPIDKQNEELILVKKYDPTKYPKYDNYDAIHIDKCVNIPADYKGVMGVPISFLENYCPKQFEILGLTSSSKNLTYSLINTTFGTRATINGNKKFARLLIKKK